MLIEFHPLASAVRLRPDSPDDAMISIAAGEDEGAEFDHAWPHLLRLGFCDLDPARAWHRLLQPRGVDPALLFTRLAGEFPVFGPREALALLAFVDGLPIGCDRIVVHCTGGVSRSCAVGHWLAERFRAAGRDPVILRANTPLGDGYPNLWVLGMLRLADAAADYPDVRQGRFDEITTPEDHRLDAKLDEMDFES